MNLIVSGSLAYDRIMDFPGYFSDHILPDKIHVLNISFTVNSLRERFGGTAGNIAYSLRLLGQDCTILSSIGRDYERYFVWLQKNGISTEHITIIDHEFTAGAYITTDLANNQITGFNPGAMKYPANTNFDELRPGKSLVVIAPGNLLDMSTCSQKCRENGIDYIFDPGQSLPMWQGPDLARCIAGARVLISNDYELEMIISRTGMQKSALLECTGALITTLGEKGSRLCTCHNGTEIVPPARPSKVVDPTGAGDSYRGGFVAGLIQGKSLLEAALMGSACASFAVECHGTQEYAFTADEFQDRLRTCGANA